ncbi:hypothetical protein V9T40_002031 [Parthenolecanium corni]|uniref:cyclin-dependent kinase n=1 Tax=Parthenolecanium corni TaxID=536013 RepID=A0AAN9Y570_9HEMI
MDSEDDSPQSISDDEEAGELLEIKPPQAKIFKHSHHRRDKHTSSRQVYIGSSTSSSSRHRKSHRSHRHDDDRAFKDRFEKIVKKSRHHKDYETERPPPPPLPPPRRHQEERHQKDRYEEKVKTSRSHHKEHEPPPEKRSRRHMPAAIVDERPDRSRNERYEMNSSKSSRSVGHIREYEPQPTKEPHYDEHKRKKSSHSHHSRREEKQKVDRARLMDDENFRFEVVDDDVHSDVEMKAAPAVEEVEQVEEEEEEEGEASSDSSSSSSSSSSSQDEEDSSDSSSEEEGEEDNEEAAPQPKKAAAVSVDNSPDDEDEDDDDDDDDEDSDANKSTSTKEETPPRVVATNEDVDTEIELEKDTLPSYFPAIQGCRSVEEFQCLNRIEEGTYGVVYRAREKRTEKIVALKRLKMEKEKEGFPITSLREINTLLKAQHPNVVTVKEIVVGSSMDKIFIVMDYVEHDLKSLMETMKQKKTAFTADEVKCLMTQLLQAVGHLHDNWILHRDLKTSNLLFSHTGVLKVGDFGLAREYGSPLKHYTPVVVTLWYRAPELLLGTKEYSTSVDMWSVGCIFAEFLRMEPLFPGKTEIDQLNRIFKALGTPTEADWPEFPKFPVVQKVPFPRHPPHGIRSEFKYLSEKGYDLLKQFLTYDTKKRVTAEAALLHDYFSEPPVAIDPAMFPTWPAKSDPSYRKAIASSPKPPSGGQDYKELGEDDGFYIGVGERNSRNYNHLQTSFKLKF